MNKRQKKIWIVIGLIIIITMTQGKKEIKKMAGTSWVYQENANAYSLEGYETSLSDPAVYDDRYWDSSHLPPLAWDGDWDTYAIGDFINYPLSYNYIFIDYVKPSDAIPSSLWQIQLEGVAKVNISIPSGCWNKEYLAFALFSGYGGGDSIGYCMDSVGSWHVLTGSGVGSQLYEEAIWWDLSGDALRIADLEDMEPNIYYLIPDNINIGCYGGETGGGFYVSVEPIYGTYLGKFLGGKNLLGELYEYEDGVEYASPQAVKIYVGMSFYICNIHIQAGEYIDITYDGGQIKRIYLPEIIGAVGTVYAARTGETYYDKALTQDACTYGNKCIKLVCPIYGDTYPACNGIDRTELGNVAQEWMNNPTTDLRTKLGDAAQDWVDNGGPA